LLAHWIKLQIYFCVTPLEKYNDAPRRRDPQFEDHYLLAANFAPLVW